MDREISNSEATRVEYFEPGPEPCLACQKRELELRAVRDRLVQTSRALAALAATVSNVGSE